MGILEIDQLNVYKHDGGVLMTSPLFHFKLDMDEKYF